jgi:hypothetical protein
MISNDTAMTERDIAGIKRLWFAVLFQAISDLSMKPKPIPKVYNQMNRSQDWRDEQMGMRGAALRWFKNESKHCGSFIWICELFEVDPGRMRVACLQRNAIFMARRLMDRLKQEEKQKKKDEREEARLQRLEAKKKKLARKSLKGKLYGT